VPGPDKKNRLQCLPKIIDDRTRVLILGSFPGARSLEKKQYYAHELNQFWRILNLSSYPYPQKKQKLLERGIGLWDVIGSCERKGSSDSNIRAQELNDLKKLFKRYPKIRTVLLNGKKAANLFARSHLNINFKVLPSTSPANAGMTLEKKRAAWNLAIKKATGVSETTHQEK